MFILCNMILYCWNWTWMSIQPVTHYRNLMFEELWSKMCPKNFFWCYIRFSFKLIYIFIIIIIINLKRFFYSKSDKVIILGHLYGTWTIACMSVRCYSVTFNLLDICGTYSNAAWCKYFPLILPYYAVT